MKLRTIVVDDEPIALEKLSAYARKVPFLELIGAYSSACEAMAVLTSPEITVDLMFTDINMPDLSGLDLISTLPSPPMVVFTTAHAQYAVESYRLAAIDYLLKPYSFADFQRAASRALERLRYIKGYGEYLQLYVEGNASPLLTLSSFAAISDRLSASFLQVHRSYIVNMDCVEQISRGRIIMDADTYIPVGDSYKTALQQWLRDHSVGTQQK